MDEYLEYLARRNNEEADRRASRVIVYLLVGVPVGCLLSCIIPALLIMSAKGITLQEFLRYF